jgi:hypothetical protein
MTDLARRVRLHVYRRHLADTGRAPTPVEVARSFDLTPSQAGGVFQSLATEADALVLLPGSSYIWMAEPFSAVPTSFPVAAGDRTWWGRELLGGMCAPVLAGEHLFGYSRRCRRRPAGLSWSPGAVRGRPRRAGSHPRCGRARPCKTTVAGGGGR